jgi:hypothetical protein
VLTRYLDEAFAAKHLSNMNAEEDSFQVFTWNLSDYKRMDKRALSPTFECGGHKWYGLTSHSFSAYCVQN